MKFGLFFEIPVDRPWTAHSELDAYQVMRSIRLMGEHVLPAFG